MPGGPVDGSGARPDAEQVVPAGPAGLPEQVPASRRRAPVRAELLPALLVFCLVCLLGVPLGWSWSRLAPVQRSVVYPGGELVPLPLESFHLFTGVAIFLLLGGATGLLTAVVLWMVRSRRGPVLLIAAVLGSLASARLASYTGTAFAEHLHRRPAASAVGDLVAVVPALDTPWVLIVQPLAVALVYGLAASWNGSDDLGRG